jgi:hypothetical protein
VRRENGQHEWAGVLTKPRRDHYVPLFLLKNFGESLYVFDKKTQSTKKMPFSSVPAWEVGLETRCFGPSLENRFGLQPSNRQARGVNESCYII